MDQQPVGPADPDLPVPPRLVVVGTGYLGATHAICYAALGHHVLGLDTDAERVARLAAGDLPFHEPLLAGLLTEALTVGRLRFTTSYREAAAFGDVHFLCVGTPQRTHGRGADLSQLDAAVEALAPLLRRPALIVGKSTVPAGTCHRLARRTSALAGPHVRFGWSPEFLREGRAVEDVLRPGRLVLGADDPQTLDALRAAHRLVYRLAERESRPLPTVTTDPVTAELTKTAANSFLATKISFANAMADLCDAAGGDVVDLARGLGLDPRIGADFLNAGVGFGGGCLPKDVRAFQARAGELGTGASLALLQEVDLINQRRIARVLSLAEQELGGLPGRRIAVLGITFKPDTDDVRESPALILAREFSAAHCRVSIYDPVGNAPARAQMSEAAYCASAAAAVAQADLVCVLTEWPEFRTADPVELGGLVANRLVLDGRNCLDPDAWRAAGWRYLALGRPRLRDAATLTAEPDIELLPEPTGIGTHV